MTQSELIYLSVMAVMMLGIAACRPIGRQHLGVPGPIINLQDCIVFLLIIIEMVLLVFITTIVGMGTFRQNLMVVGYGSVIIVVAIGLILVFNRMEKDAEKDKEATLLKQQVDMQAKYYDGLEAQAQHARVLTTTMRERIQTLDKLYQEGDLTAVQNYVDGTMADINATSPPFSVTNHTLAVVLADKWLCAQQQNTPLQVEDGSAGLEGMNPFDITTIFANLLDNALTATENQEEGEGIRVILRQQGGMVAITISNPLTTPIKRNRGKHFVSTKSSAGHGIGLKNVRHAVEKYQGTMDIIAENGVFQVNILLPLPMDGN